MIEGPCIILSSLCRQLRCRLAGFIEASLVCSMLSELLPMAAFSFRYCSKCAVRFDSYGILNLRLELFKRASVAILSLVALCVCLSRAVT